MRQTPQPSLLKRAVPEGIEMPPIDEAIYRVWAIYRGMLMQATTLVPKWEGGGGESQHTRHVSPSAWLTAPRSFPIYTCICKAALPAALHRASPSSRISCPRCTPSHLGIFNSRRR